jgi:hypothetical protein
MAILINDNVSDSSDEEPSSAFSDEDITPERQMEIIRLNTNGLYHTICGTRVDPPLETKLNAKIDKQTDEINETVKRKMDDQANEIKCLKRKLNDMDAKMDRMLALLGD